MPQCSEIFAWNYQDHMMVKQGFPTCLTCRILYWQPITIILVAWSDASCPPFWHYTHSSFITSVCTLYFSLCFHVILLTSGNQYIWLSSWIACFHILTILYLQCFLQMFDDQDLGFFTNFLGIFIFVLVIAYHFVMADPKYENWSPFV